VCFIGMRNVHYPIRKYGVSGAATVRGQVRQATKDLETLHSGFKVISLLYEGCST